MRTWTVKARGPIDVWTGWQKVRSAIHELSDIPITDPFFEDELTLIWEQFQEAKQTLLRSGEFDGLVRGGEEWMFCADTYRDRGDGWCDLVFAIKQDNNGTTFIVRQTGPG